MFKEIPIGKTNIQIIDGDRGKNYPKKNDLLENGHTLFLNNKNIINNFLDDSFGEYITEEKSNSLRKGKLRRGDIVMSTRGSVGNIGYYSEKVKTENIRINSGMVIIRNEDSNIDTEFLYILLRSNFMKQKYKEYITGSVQNQLPIKDLKRVPIIIPPLNLQKEIKNIVLAIDYKIENNNSIIANLEEQAQTIFKSWFVDFEPFQEEAFVSSELGNIPSFWQVVEANDWFKINIGKTPPRKQSEWFSTNPNDIKWLSISDMKNIQTFANKTSEYLTNEAVDKFNVRIAPANSVLLSFKLTIGRVAITRDELTTNEAIAHFHTNKHMELYYLYIYLNTFNYNKLGNTSSIGNAVNSKIIKAMPILKPNDKTLMKFHTVIEPLFNMIYEKVKENEKLETIRDILLPHLMSGEIRVEEAIEVEEM